MVVRGHVYNIWDINIALFYDFSIGFRNCSPTMWIFSFFSIVLHCVQEVNSISELSNQFKGLWEQVNRVARIS